MVAGARNHLRQTGPWSFASRSELETRVWSRSRFRPTFRLLLRQENWTESPGLKHQRRRRLQAKRNGLRRWFRLGARDQLPLSAGIWPLPKPLAVRIEPRYRRVSSDAPTPDGPSPAIRYPAVPAVRPHPPVLNRGPASVRSPADRMFRT